MRFRFSPSALLWLAILLLMASDPAEAQDKTPVLQSVGMLQASDVSARVVQRARASVMGASGTAKDGPMAKLGMELALVYHQSRMKGAAGVQALRVSARPKGAGPKTEGLKSTGGSSEGAFRRPQGHVLSPLSLDGRSVLVSAIASGNPARLLADLQALGLTGGDTAGAVVSGRLPVEKLRAAAQVSSLRGMLPAYARTHVGSVESEADTAHATVEVRETRNLDGSGQKICALSDSYDALGQANQDIDSGDLPGSDNPIGNTTPVDVVQEGGSGNTDEGRAMLQLIHDIAPGATLGFHTAVGGLAVFAQGIRDLADAGCTVIVDDIRYNTEPFYQDGPVSNAVNDVAKNEGIPYFTSAGNDGQNSYEAPFRNSGEPGIIDSSSVAHDFDPSSETDTRQEITLEAGGNFRIFAFQWTDPSSIVSGSEGADTDIDVALVNEAGTVVAESSSDNIATGVPLESIDYTNETDSVQTLNLAVEKFAGPDPQEIKYVYSGRGYAIQEYDTLGPTVYGHPMAERAVAVAAAPFFNTAAYNPNLSSATLESFSSKGGIPLLFDQDGQRLATPVVRQKPDVTGTDGIDNTFFGTDIPDTALGGLDSDPHPNFFGTSAAAPNIAAIAALVQEARPEMAPAGVYDRLESTAADVTSRQRRDGAFVAIPDGKGVDSWSGHGFVRADRAVPEIASGHPSDLVATADTGAVRLAWVGPDAPDLGSYRIYRSTAPIDSAAGPSGLVPLDSTNAGDTTYVDTSATPGTKYHYRVTAVDTAANESSFSGEASATPHEETLVSIRNQTAAPLGAVDLSIGAENFLQVEAFSLVIDYDPSVLSFSGGDLQTEDLISDPIRASFAAARLEPGELRVSWSDSTGANPIDLEEGTLFTIAFDEFSGDSTEVTFRPGSEVEGVDGNSVGAAFEGGTVAPTPGVPISGTVAYPREGGAGLTGGRRLSGVPVELVSVASGKVVATDTTGGDGTFNTTVQVGRYVAQARPGEALGIPSSEINATDAIRTVRAFTGASPLANAFQREVADVNDNGSINATDALLMALFFNDPGGTTFAAGEWATTSDTADVSDGSDARVVMRAAAYGDANLSGAEQESTGIVATAGAQSDDPSSGPSSGSPSLNASSGASSGAGQDVRQEGSLRSVETGGTFEVPVRLNRSVILGAYSLQVEFSSDKTSFEGVVAESGSEADVSRDVMSTVKSDTVRLSWFDRSGETPMKRSAGTPLVTLRFRAASSVEEGTVFSPEVTDGELAGPNAQPLAGVEVSAGGVEIGSALPEEFSLEASYPNPTRGRTTVEMNLPSQASVRIEIYNVLGQRVQTAKQLVRAGTGQTVQVDGSGLASGQYFYRVRADLETGTAEETGRLTILR